MKKHLNLVSLVLCASFALSACGPGQPPPTNLKDAFSATFEYAVMSGKLEGESTRVVDVTSNYDVSNSTPKWVSASFLYMAFIKGGGANFLGVTIDTAGDIGDITFEPGTVNMYAGPGLLKGDVQFFLGNTFVEEILAKAWEELGNEINSNCGPVTNIKYRAVSAEKSPMDTVSNFIVTYNGKQSIVLRSVTDIADIDTACP